MGRITKEYLKNGEYYEKTETEIIASKNNDRGLVGISFEDRSGYDCSIQSSSLATEPAIWFGIPKPEVKVFNNPGGWSDVSLPESALITSRMHLTQAMVVQLLPYLKEFAKTGYLPTKIPKRKTKKRSKK